MENEFRRAIVMGCACVITSKLTVEQIENFKQYMPEMLTMVDEEGKPVFTVDIGDAAGCLENDKAVYSNTKMPDGKATITILIDPDEEDKPGIVKKYFGIALLRLEEIEQGMLSYTDELNETIRKVDRMICR